MDSIVHLRSALDNLKPRAESCDSRLDKRRLAGNCGVITRKALRRKPRVWDSRDTVDG